MLLKIWNAARDAATAIRTEIDGAQRALSMSFDTVSGRRARRWKTESEAYQALQRQSLIRDVLVHVYMESGDSDLVAAIPKGFESFLETGYGKSRSYDGHLRSHDGAPITTRDIEASWSELGPRGQAELIDRHALEKQERQEQASGQAERQHQMDRWDLLDQAVGGNLFTNDTKLRAMRRIDRRTSESNTSPEAWARFHDAVVTEVARVEAMTPAQRHELDQQDWADRLDAKSAMLQEQVQRGRITQQEADERFQDYTNVFSELEQTSPQNEQCQPT